MFSIYVKTLYFLPVWTIRNTQYKCSNNTTKTTTITFSNNQLILKDVYDIVYGEYDLDCDLNIFVQVVLMKIFIIMDIIIQQQNHMVCCFVDIILALFILCFVFCVLQRELLVYVLI